MNWIDFTSRPQLLALILGAVILLLAVGAGVWKVLRNRPTPEELERQRRLAVNSVGKLGVGEVLDVEGSAILYSYLVAGVEYTASQDVLAFQNLLPDDPMSLIGPISVRFDPRNPANSIVICEEWSGLQRSNVRHS